MIKVRIESDGTIRALWNDGLDWGELGPVSVRRASHVEFCDRRQLWYVRAGRPSSRIRRFLQRVLCRPLGEIVHWAKTRQEALDGEENHFGPGGQGWIFTRRIRRSGGSGQTIGVNGALGGP